MRRTITIVLAAGLALTMTACEALDSVLQVNIFEPFAAMSAADISSASTDELLTMSGSGAFYDALAEDPAAKTTVIATLEATQAAAAPDSPEFQEVTVLLASIVLETTPAADFVGNIASVITEVMATPAEGEELDIEAIVQSLLPPEVYVDGTLNEEAFIEMLDALADADLYFQQLGLAIGTDGYADGAEVSAGDVAQQALVAAMVASVEPPVGFVGTQGEYLFALMTDETTPPPTDFTMPDMESGYLYNLLLAANLDLSGVAE